MYYRRRRRSIFFVCGRENGRVPCYTIPKIIDCSVIKCWLIGRFHNRNFHDRTHETVSSSSPVTNWRFLKLNFPPERWFFSLSLFLLFCSFLVLIMRDSSATFIVEIGRHQIGTYGSFFFLNRKYPILVCHMMMMMMTLYKLRVFTYNGLQRSYHCFSWTIFFFLECWTLPFHDQMYMRYKSLVVI